MADDNAVTLYNSNPAITDAAKKNPFSIKVAMAQMLRGGAIVEVTTLDQARIAESAGACCVVVSDPRKPGISRRKGKKSKLKEKEKDIAGRLI